MILPERHIYVSVSAGEGPFPVSELLKVIREAAPQWSIHFTQREGAEAALVSLRDISTRIQASDLVVELVGNGGAQFLAPFSLEETIQPPPPPGSRARTWQDLVPLGCHRLIITEWEGLLAQFWKKPLCRWEASGFPGADTGGDLKSLRLPPHPAVPGPRLLFSSLSELSFLAKRELQEVHKLRIPQSLVALSCAAVSLVAAFWMWRSFPLPWPQESNTPRTSVSPTLWPQADQEQVSTVDERELASFLSLRDKLQISCLCSGQSFLSLSPGMVLATLAERASLPEDSLPRLVEKGMGSTSAVVRARALLLRGEYRAALDALPTVAPTAPPGLADYLQVKAQAREALGEQGFVDLRQQRAPLINPSERPDEWADAQIFALLFKNPPTTEQESTVALKAVLAIRQDRLGSDHSDTIDTRDQLARRMLAAREFAEAASELKENSAACERLFGPWHRRTLGCRFNLASALSHAGFHEEAIQLHQAVLSGRRRIMPGNDPEMVDSHNNLGAAFLKAGRTAEAEQEYRGVLESYFRGGARAPAELAKIRFNLALALAAQQRWKAARGFAEEASRGFNEALGPASPQAVHVQGLAVKLKLAELTGIAPDDLER
jgi:tetratricopeptide (TPR) repeat protein